MKEKILLIGGGGHCKSVIDVIEQEAKFEIAGIIDQKELVGSKVLDYKVVGCDDDLEALREKYSYVFITIGQIKSPKRRVDLFNKVKHLEFKVPVIISPRAYISKYAQIDEGTIVMHDVLINTNATIGKNCIINTKALIEHDVVIEDNCHISTGAILNGGVIVKEGTFLGSNAVAKEGITIEGFIKAGSLVK